MKLLSELLSLSPLSEAEKTPIEISDVVKNFPNKKRDAVIKLFDAGRLTWGGKNIVDMYADFSDAAEAFIKENIKGEVDVRVDGPDGDSTIEVNFEAEIIDLQECYMGYNLEHDRLVIGFDAWLNSDDEFNQAFDEAFKEATGEEHDMDNEEHQAIYNEAWREYNDNKMGFVGVVVFIEHDGEGFEVVDSEMAPMTNGFYRGAYKIVRRMVDVDIRLD